MLPKLLRSFLFLFFFSANSLPAELFACNFSLDADGPEDELCAIYYASIDDDSDDTKIITEFFFHPCGTSETIFQSQTLFRFTKAGKNKFFATKLKSDIPLYIRKRALLI